MSEGVAHIKGKYRSWVFTYHLSEEEIQLYSSIDTTQEPNIENSLFSLDDDKRIVFMVYQLEKATTTGKLHMQGVVGFTCQLAMSGVKKIFGDRVHLEPCMDLPKAIEYCSKADTKVMGPWKFGEPTVHAGKRSDLVKIYEDTKAGISFAAQVEADPRVARFHKCALLMQSIVQKPLSDR